MATVTYTVFSGEVLSENRNGVERDYVPDPSGNVVALLDDSQNITDTFQYWSYGELMSRTGSTPISFKFGGALGYYTDGDGSIYVRRRRLDPETGRWQTVDPFWPSDEPYSYAYTNPVTFHDASGFRPSRKPGNVVTCSPAWRDWISNFCHGCRKNKFNPDCMAQCDRYVDSYFRACGWPVPIKPGPKPKPKPVYPPGCQETIDNFSCRFKNIGGPFGNASRPNEGWWLACIECAINLGIDRNDAIDACANGEFPGVFGVDDPVDFAAGVLRIILLGRRVIQ